MKNSNIIRAWKDQAYRDSLSAAERAALPENPAGALELVPEQAGRIKGGQTHSDPIWVLTTNFAGCVNTGRVGCAR